MHIAIDAHMVGERETGNETYTVNLVRSLLRCYQESMDARGRRTASDPDVRFSLLATHPERLRAALADLPPNARILTMRPANPLLRIPLVMPALAARHRFDLLHVTYNAPPVVGCPTVVSIHDISFETFPQFFSPRDRAILKALVPGSARRAARIITGSRHTQSEITAFYGIPADRIAVIPYAAGEAFRPVEDPRALQAVRRNYGIGDRPFVLALGNLQPRKNIGRLVRAFADVISHDQLLTTGHRPLTPDHCKLVIAGKAQWQESDIYRAVADAGIEDRVVFPGYVADEDLPALYSAASALVYPSLYEGFGIPPLEAMACGTPVICSHVASLPEVVGDAALTIDPGNVEDLAGAIAAVLGDPGLHADLRGRGLRRAARFSWDRCAAETMAVYRDVVAGSRR